MVIYNTGEVLQELKLADGHEGRFGAPYLQLHRADFHEILAAVRNRSSHAAVRRSPSTRPITTVARPSPIYP